MDLGSKTEEPVPGEWVGGDEWYGDGFVVVVGNLAFDFADGVALAEVAPAQGVQLCDGGLVFSSMFPQCAFSFR